MARPTEPEITLTMSMQRLNDVLQVLGKGPFEQVAEILANFRAQAQEQINEFTAAQQQQRPGPTLVHDQPNS